MSVNASCVAPVGGSGMSNGYGRVTVVVLSTAVAVALAMSSARAETAAQREACKPDVFRFCSEFIPNHAAIVACLERNSDHLSSACRAVFDSKPK
jgi:hypothetical protein